MLDKLVNVRLLSYGAVLLAPVFLAGLVTGNPLWLRAEIVTVSAFIAAERSRLAPLGVLVHVVAICVGFIAMTLALGTPEWFVVACMLLAATCVSITAAGAQMRWTGAFTCIPVLYVACATAHDANGRGMMQLCTETCPYLFCAALPVIFASIVSYRAKQRAAKSNVRAWLVLRQVSETPAPNYLEGMIAAAFAVGVAAWLAEWHRVPYPQWLIWSAASVVTGDIASARAKWKDRIVGAIVGVSAGMLFGIFMPHAPLLFSILTALVALTLVAFNQYVVAFGTRCALHAVAIIVAGHSIFSADARMINVVLGSTIGIVFVLGTHFIGRSIKRH
ncbi:hypothetical protein LMG28614_04251 [Paraburkholderia ultramafica]|uniref:Integral membrane bound transporter domain-containing protein n=1 Tax=Paraburkholderia ultramafica TaxID=1544867 RepID=A0A6S7BCU2_9BURK|nr:FUSC family protein [Paraburkholderia ultramafica]CAB3795891.1 hypothetical protein LMG28614_04251 [Paraburkholderia ultramafica]